MTHYVYKPWKDEKDAENVLFASIHGYGKLANNVDFFYPGSGHAPNKVHAVSGKEMGVEIATPTILDVCVSREQGKVAFFWREQLRRNVLPRLLEFRPDLIFLSFGEKDGRC